MSEIKKVDIRDIAKRAGVSTATVSRALNGSGSIRENTRRKILQIAREYNYKPNPLARGLSRQKTDTIGVILPELADEFFMDIIHSIDEQLYQANRYIMVSSSHGQRNIVETLIEFMSSGRVDGVILMVPEMNRELAALVKQSKRPVVLINSGEFSTEMVSFNINNYQGAFAITEHLIEHGYRKIATIKGPEGNCEAHERYRGYVAALEKNDLAPQNSFVVSGNFSVESGQYGFMRLMSQFEKPDAIFAANDMMALGTYQAAKQAYICIPRDVAIAGFDDIQISRLLTPRLTTMHVPIMELGQKAVRYLLEMISGEVDPKQPYREGLPTGLVIGGSCGCVPI